MKKLIKLLKNIIYTTIGLLVFIPVYIISPFKLKKFKADQIKGILVISRGGLGNLIMLLPFLNVIKNEFKNGGINILTTNKAQYDFIITMLPEINVVLMPQEAEHIINGIKFIKKAFAGKHIDLSFHPYLEHNGRSVWWSRFIGTHIIVGFAPPLYGPWQTIRLNINKEISEGENNLNMLRTLGIQVYVKDKLISLNEKVRKNAKVLLNEKLKNSGGIIGFHCGSSFFGKDKRWGEDNFIKLIKTMLSTYYDLGVIVFFGPDESELYNIFYNAFENERRIWLINTGDMPLLCAIMENATLFVTNDSGPMHIASAMGVPIVSIWGPTDPVKNRPWGKDVEIIRLGLNCSPCYKIGHLNTCTDMLCFKGISTDMVFDIIAKKII